jgi:DNA replicative helicase MCM subunit Mcm2 (Cdc46/Mcm family)
MVAEGVSEALKVYKDVDLEGYEMMVRDAISFITTGKKELRKDYAEEEEKVLEIIAEMQKEEGAIWDEVIQEAERRGMERKVVEEVMVILLEKGQIYEPQLGKIKMV